MLSSRKEHYVRASASHGISHRRPAHSWWRRNFLLCCLTGANKPEDVRDSYEQLSPDPTSTQGCSADCVAVPAASHAPPAAPVAGTDATTQGSAPLDFDAAPIATSTTPGVQPLGAKLAASGTPVPLSADQALGAAAGYAAVPDVAGQQHTTGHHDSSMQDHAAGQPLDGCDEQVHVHASTQKAPIQQQHWLHLPAESLVPQAAAEQQQGQEANHHAAAPRGGTPLELQHDGVPVCVPAAPAVIAEEPYSPAALPPIRINPKSGSASQGTAGKQQPSQSAVAVQSHLQQPQQHQQQQQQHLSVHQPSSPYVDQQFQNGVMAAILNDVYSQQDRDVMHDLHQQRGQAQHAAADAAAVQQGLCGFSSSDGTDKRALHHSKGQTCSGLTVGLPPRSPSRLPHSHSNFSRAIGDQQQRAGLQPTAVSTPDLAGLGSSDVSVFVQQQQQDWDVLPVVLSPLRVPNQKFKQDDHTPPSPKASVVGVSCSNVINSLLSEDGFPLVRTGSASDAESPTSTGSDGDALTAARRHLNRIRRYSQRSLSNSRNNLLGSWREHVTGTQPSVGGGSSVVGKFSSSNSSNQLSGSTANNGAAVSSGDDFADIGSRSADALQGHSALQGLVEAHKAALLTSVDSYPLADVASNDSRAGSPRMAGVIGALGSSVQTNASDSAPFSRGAWAGLGHSDLDHKPVSTAAVTPHPAADGLGGVQDMFVGGGLQ